MIKKLESYPIIRSDGAICGFDSPGNSEITDKVNEIIDVLNHILEERESDLKVSEEAQDMYDNAILDALKDKQVDVVVEPDDNITNKGK